MAKEKQYSVTEILDEIIDSYQYSESEGSLRKKIQEVCEQIPSADEYGRVSNLWETSNGGKKGASHYFTESEKSQILHSPVLTDFIRERYNKIETEIGGFTCSDDDRKKCSEPVFNFMCRFWEKVVLKEQAGEANQANREYFDSPAYLKKAPGIDLSPTPGEIMQKKIEIMMEALFLRYFTPVDVEKLERDMILERMGGGDDNTAETLKAISRLKDGSNYYEEREDCAGK